MGRSRGSIRKRGTDKYLIRVYVGKVDGKRKYTSKTVRGSKTDAEKALTALKYDVDSGSYSDPSGLTVSAWSTQWLKGKRNLRETTRMDYEARLRLDVEPHVGHLKLDELKPHHCRAVMAAMDERGLSQRTKQYGHMIFKQCMGQAKKDGLIPTNPMENVERPSVRKQDKVQKITPLSREEIASLLEASKGSKYHALWLLLLTTGLRPSEALALEWDAVDFENGSIQVKQGMSRVGQGEYEIGGLKTDSSHRRVPMPPTLADGLKAHRASVRQKQMLIGKRSELVFPNGAFAPMDISKVRKAWKRACKRAEGVPVVRLYDTRHSVATNLLRAGMNPKAAAEILGHSSTKMLLDVYSHLTDKDREGLASEVEAAMFGT